MNRYEVIRIQLIRKFTMRKFKKKGENFQQIIYSPSSFMAINSS